jgi:hypothetical protein
MTPHESDVPGQNGGDAEPAGAWTSPDADDAALANPWILNFENPPPAPPAPPPAPPRRRPDPDLFCD